MGKTSNKEFNDGFFYLPNSVVDQALDILGTRGIALYVVLARQPTRSSYPSGLELASRLKISIQKVREIISKLQSLGLLNSSDARSVLGNDEEEI